MKRLLLLAVLVGCSKRPLAESQKHTESLQEETSRIETSLKKAQTDMDAAEAKAVGKPSSPNFNIRYTDARWSGAGPKDLLMFNANDNATEYALSFAWPRIPGTTDRAPCGGEATCPDPNKDEAACFITVTDCNFGLDAGHPENPKVLRTVYLRCSGLENCWHSKGPATRCCHLAGVGSRL